MSKHRLLVVIAVGLTLALTSVLPAFAGDREDRGTREARAKAPRQVAAKPTGVQPSIKTSPNAAGRVAISSRGGELTPAGPAFQKSQCSGTCGDISFTCSGSSTYCEDGLGCAASGGGVTLYLVCLD